MGFKIVYLNSQKIGYTRSTMRLLIKLILDFHFTLILLAAGGLQAQSLTSLEYWEFNDLAGKSFSTTSNPNGMVNSGDNASYWNFGGTSGTMQTDGNGNFVITGHSGQTYRKLPDDPGYANPYSTSKYRMEMDFNSWNLDGTVAGSSLGMELVDSSGARIASFLLGTDTSNNARFQFSGISNGALVYQSEDVGLVNTTTAYAVAAEFDFDNNTLDFLLNGTSVRAITDFDATEFAQMKFFTNNPWSANSTVSLDSMGLHQVIPEPQTYALTLGVFALLVRSLRRRCF